MGDDLEWQVADRKSLHSEVITERQEEAVRVLPVFPLDDFFAYQLQSTFTLKNVHSTFVRC